jgi:hypothetical protein
MSSKDIFNQRLESLVGAQPLYQPSTHDIDEISLYCFFKPVIYAVFDAFNHGKEKPENMAILLSTFPFDKLGYTDPKQLYSYLYQVDDGLIPSIVIQGGEAVNLYTQNKFENVMTHDCDVRLRIGGHFNYTKPIEELREDVQKRAMQFKLVVSYSLNILMIRWLESMLNEHRPPQKINKFLQTWLLDRNIIINKISAINAWTNTDIINITPSVKELQSLYIINIEYTAPTGKKGHSVTDIMFPYPRNEIGHSLNIDTFFSSPQMKSAGIDVPPGRVPSIDFDIKTPSYTTVTRTQQLKVVPFAYILWDTMRMLLVSKQYEDMRDVTNKRQKYAQKLSCLFATLYLEDEHIPIQQSMTKYKELRPYLMGGVKTNSDVEHQVTTTKRMPTTDIAASKEFSNKLFDDAQRGELLKDLTKLNDIEWAGYMDYMSRVDTGFREFRLPDPPIQAEPIKPLSPDVSKALNMFLFGSPASTAGQRRKTYRQKKKSRKHTR